jgi:hypothetical protein
MSTCIDLFLRRIDLHFDFTHGRLLSSIVVIIISDGLHPRRGPHLRSPIRASSCRPARKLPPEGFPLRRTFSPQLLTGVLALTRSAVMNPPPISQFHPELGRTVLTTPDKARMRRHQPGTVRIRPNLTDPTRHGHANSAVEKPLGRGCAVRYIVTPIQAAASYQLTKLRLFFNLESCDSASGRQRREPRVYMIASPGDSTRPNSDGFRKCAVRDGSVKAAPAPPCDTGASLRYVQLFRAIKPHRFRTSRNS